MQIFRNDEKKISMELKQYFDKTPNFTDIEAEFKYTREGGVRVRKFFCVDRVRLYFWGSGGSSTPF